MYNIRHITTTPFLRGEIHDFCFIFNCFHGKVNCDFSNVMELVDISTGRLSAQKKIFKHTPCENNDIL